MYGYSPEPLPRKRLREVLYHAIVSVPGNLGRCSLYSHPCSKGNPPSRAASKSNRDLARGAPWSVPEGGAAASPSTALHKAPPTAPGTATSALSCLGSSQVFSSPGTRLTPETHRRGYGARGRKGNEGETTQANRTCAPCCRFHSCIGTVHLKSPARDGRSTHPVARLDSEPSLCCYHL